MKLYTKDELIDNIRAISQKGWIKSVKETRDTRNDGAVGNTLENLLGITENNLPIPNAREWELKGQRSHSTSLITLKHIEPSPQAARIVARILLPKYGWRHKEAGKKYPISEMSFRSTTYATSYTNRGFRIMVDQEQQMIRFVFEATNADKRNPDIASWLKTVEKRVGVGPLDPEPYWGFEDLKYQIGAKIKNCFYVIADSKIDGGREYFKYRELYILSGFSSTNFIKCIENSTVCIDFDARTGHNHGTKFRIKQDSWTGMYDYVVRAF